eukprot:438941-Rhodomonas_salina.1
MALRRLASQIVFCLVAEDRKQARRPNLFCCCTGVHAVANGVSNDGEVINPKSLGVMVGCSIQSRGE